jgi:uncharacterized protein
VNVRDPNVTVAEGVTQGRSTLVPGLEQLGLLPYRTPILSLVIAAALVVSAVLGIEPMLFRSNSPAFRQFEEVSREFPSRNCARWSPTCNSSKGRGVLSMFSAREPFANGDLPAPLFPDTFPAS